MHKSSESFPSPSDDQIVADCATARRRAADLYLADRTLCIAEQFGAAHELTAELFLETDDLRDLGRARGARKKLVRYLLDVPLSADVSTLLVSEHKNAPLQDLAPLGADLGFQDVVAHLVAAECAGRYPWLLRGADPGDEERASAISDIARRYARQKAETEMRSRADRRQRTALTNIAAAAGLRARRLPNDTLRYVTDLEPGEYSEREVTVRAAERGGVKADFVARLGGGELLLIEAKYSGSKTNSVKRISREVPDKAVKWAHALGSENVIVGAFIGGVMSPVDVQGLRQLGIIVIWEHAVAPYEAWLRSLTASAPPAGTDGRQPSTSPNGPAHAGPPDDPSRNP